MSRVERSAQCVWEGDLIAGSGMLSAGSGALNGKAVTWASRIEKPNGRTSPEELMASAHAACFAMALSLILGQQDAHPQRLTVEARCGLETDPTPRIVTMDLHVRGTVPGLDPVGFRDAAKKAGEVCPVSQALQGNVRVAVSADLEHPAQAGPTRTE